MKSMELTTENRPLEKEELNSQFQIYREVIQNILDAFPLPTALLNQQGEIIAINNNFIKLFDLHNTTKFIGKKPAEIFRCIFNLSQILNSKEENECRNCGLIETLRTSKNHDQSFHSQCHLIINDQEDTDTSLLKMNATTSPFSIFEEPYYLFTIIDISNDIRRRLLEKIFYHDALNKACNIVGILEVLDIIDKDDKKSPELYESLKLTSYDLINEIKSQRDISLAENNELTPVMESVYSLDILQTAIKEIVNSEIASKKVIVIDDCATNHEIITDGLLLRRIILNMVKNALEAVKIEEKITIGCQPKNRHHFRFWVHNDTVIPEEIQAKLFNKITSTKGMNRGLGTFSMKLLGEKYLKGMVNFTSNKNSGTKFYIDIPYNNDVE